MTDRGAGSARFHSHALPAPFSPDDARLDEMLHQADRPRWAPT